jgi:hypothetical protein
MAIPTTQADGETSLMEGLLCRSNAMQNENRKPDRATIRRSRSSIERSRDVG